MPIVIQKFIRRSFPVEAVRVTHNNMHDVAAWCGGELQTEAENGHTVRFVKVEVHMPLSERQTKAYLGDWVLFAGKGYKVYTDRGFGNSFDKLDEVPFAPEDNVERLNVFDDGEVASSSPSSNAGANPGGSNIFVE